MVPSGVYLVRLLRVNRLLDLLGWLLLDDQLLRLVHLLGEVILNRLLILMVNDLRHVGSRLQEVGVALHNDFRCLQDQLESKVELKFCRTAGKALSYLLLVLLDEIVIQSDGLLLLLLLLHSILVLRADVGVEDLLGLLGGGRLDQVLVLHRVLLRDVLLVLFHGRVDDVLLLILLDDRVLLLRVAPRHDELLLLLLLQLQAVVSVQVHVNLLLHVCDECDSR